MKRIWIVLVIFATLVCGQMNAQSVSYAQSLIEQERYIEAAKVLRPLADGGNAEAQLMAAKLFYEGKGVDYNKAQSEKYATLSADQGNEDAIIFLLEHFLKHRSEKDIFEALKKWTDRHPQLLRSITGAALAECYLKGKGCEVQEDRAWDILQNNVYLERMINNEQDSWKAYQERHQKTSKIYDSVEQMPCFPGGASALNQYLNNEINYPAICISNKIQGRVIVSFVINRDGSISDAKIVRSIEPALDKEALRVVRKMPNWIPGRHNGSPVRVKYTIPITFKL